jgi:hypothetical protein
MSLRTKLKNKNVYFSAEKAYLSLYLSTSEETYIFSLIQSNIAILGKPIITFSHHAGSINVFAKKRVAPKNCSVWICNL